MAFKVSMLCSKCDKTEFTTVSFTLNLRFSKWQNYICKTSSPL